MSVVERRAVLDRLEREVAESRDELVCLVGPTASGKTALAVDLAARVGGEIVSADSVQIYARFDAGSGKPTAEERARARFHLVGTESPDAPMDAARFTQLADAAIDDVRARGRVPIVCGGTWLWVKALTQGLAELPARDASLRAAHHALVAEQGARALHEALARVDPDGAARLHPNDTVRVSRALEVHALTGRPLGELQRAGAAAAPRHPSRVYALAVPPPRLDTRIAARVDAFFADGWVDEVRALLEDGLGDARAMGAVGYKEVRLHLEGGLREDELRPAIVRATRTFARKQRTWLRSEAVTWLALAGDGVTSDGA